MNKNSILKYVFLPKEISNTELKHVKKINKVALWVCIAHLPLFILVTHLCHTSYAQAIIFWSLLLVAPVLGIFTFQNPRTLSLIYGFTSMGLGALLVHLGQGPMQIEMHFHFFASLALLTVWANPLVIWVAAITVALHHALFWLFLPQSVFNYNASFWVVLVHALFVIVEAIAASFIARNFYDNVIGLDKIIQEKTQTIRNILDHVTYGLFICDENLILQEGYSHSCMEFFKSAESKLNGQCLTNLLQLNERDAENMLTLYSQVFEDIGPESLTLGQIPNRFHLHSKNIALSGSVIRNSDNSIHSVLFCIMDVTALVKAENQVEEAKSIFKILQQKESFQFFMNDLLEKISIIKNDLPSIDEKNKVKQHLHTIKGNLSIYGLTDFVNIIHSLEEKQKLTLDEFNLFEKALNQFLTKNYSIIGISPEKAEEIRLTISEREIIDFEKRSLQISDIESFKNLTAHFCEKVRMRPIQKLLGPVEETCNQMSKRFGKKIRIQITGENLIVPESMTEVTENIMHLLRNSIFHGIELPRERGSKPKEALIQVNFSIQNDILSIQIADDGRGINTEALVKKAIENKIIDAEKAQNLSPEDKLNLIFVENLTTATEVNDISGRGLGMSAVQSAVQKSNGSIKVTSELGKGTVFVITVPYKGLSSFQENSSKAA